MTNKDLITDSDSLFKSIKQGLEQAIAYERGEDVDVKIDRITVSPAQKYSRDKIKQEMA